MNEPHNYSEWQQVVEREIARGARRYRVRVDFRSEDGTAPSPHVSEPDYLAELLETEAKLTSQLEDKGLRVELLRSVANIFYTRFSVDLAEFGRRHSDSDLRAMIAKQRDKNEADFETEAQFRRRMFKNSKRMYGDKYVRSVPELEGERKLLEARRSAGRIPVQVLFDDLRERQDGRWLGLTSKNRINELLMLEETKVWASLKGFPTYEVDAKGRRKSVRGIYGAQLARDAARFLGPDFEPEEVEVSSPRILRW